MLVGQIRTCIKYSAQLYCIYCKSQMAGDGRGRFAGSLKTERPGITMLIMLICDKSQLKGNTEQSKN